MSEMSLASYAFSSPKNRRFS